MAVLAARKSDSLVVNFDEETALRAVLEARAEN
jgi:hypothetical protein